VGHHVLLAHAAAVQRFRQTMPAGKIGIVANSDFFEPLTNSAADKVVSLLSNFMQHIHHLDAHASSCTRQLWKLSLLH